MIAMRSRAILAVLVVLGVAGCRGTDSDRPDTSGSTAGGSTTHTIVVDGHERSYRLYRPAGLTSPAALVVMLHGGFGSGEQAEASYGWDRLADREHILVAYPDGLDRAWAVGGGCCGRPGNTGVDDTGFITALVAAVGQAVPVDPHRVFATGISNGGMLAYRLACDSTVFAAIGPDSATMLGPCPTARPVSVIHIHGTADQRVRYDGELGDGVGRIDGPPVPDVLAHWRQTDNCPQPTVTVDGLVTRSIAACPDGRSVELVTIDGAGHQWPGSVPKSLVERALGLDPPSTALDATEEIWRFFAAHPSV
jgi:polyhydroxybutyrate depolymerase